MNTHSLSLAIASILSAASLTASAAIVYESNPTATWFTWSSYSISGLVSISSRFVLNSSATISGAVVGAWNIHGQSMTSVDWRITTQHFGGTEVASGTADVVNQFVAYLDGSDMNKASFSLGADLSLNPGTYWLQLGSSGADTYWDYVAPGSSEAWVLDGGTPYRLEDYIERQIIPGSPSFQITPGSPSFQLFNTLSPVPEPSEWAAISFGLLGIVWVVKRRFAPACA